MNSRIVEDIANAVLYEGYILYPYRASAVKNRQRWNFGVLYPRDYAEAQSGADAWSMQTECLVKARSVDAITARVRFLHLIPRTLEGQVWHEAMERDVQLQVGARQDFKFSADEAGQRAIEGRVETETERLADALFKIRLSIVNSTPGGSGVSQRDEVLLLSFVSTHTILSVDDGEFISLLDPPEDLRGSVAMCHNIGTYPVLVGEEGRRDAMLSSPIILYDYPKIAPESPGALFDGTEIDEILTLRIMTLTDDEKREMGTLNDHAREILERTESMPREQFMKMHGIFREVS
jgi:hypothetical protein